VACKTVAGGCGCGCGGARLGRDATCRRWVLAAVFRLGFPRQARRVNVQPRCLDASGASGTRPVMMKVDIWASRSVSARHASIASVSLWATPVRRGCGARPITATRLHHHHHQRAPPSPLMVTSSRRADCFCLSHPAIAIITIMAPLRLSRWPALCLPPATYPILSAGHL
jgi:hypothetical protein